MSPTSVATELRARRVIHCQLMTTSEIPTPGASTDSTSVSRSSRRSILLLAAMALSVLVVPALLRGSSESESFDQSAVDKLNSQNPELVFLGNSLLETRIDSEYLSELTGSSIVSLATDGTGPGVWYLQLANVVGGSRNRPESVFVFFHDDLITRPISFTGPANEALIEQLQHPAQNSDDAESTYETISENTSLRMRLANLFRAIYPVASVVVQDRDPVSSSAAFLTGSSRSDLPGDSDAVFAFANKRDQSQIIQQPKYHGPFESAVEGSFLPALINVANEMGIDLTFVRTSARPNDDGTPNESVSLAQYSLELANYLESQNIRYIDMTGHPGIDLAMYYDGYHLKHRFRSHYTEIFGEWLLAEKARNP